MEILFFILFCWLISCLFPSPAEPRFGPTLEDVLGFVACTLFLVFLFCAYWYSFAGILLLARYLDWNDGVTFLLAAFGPIATPMIIVELVQFLLISQQNKIKQRETSMQSATISDND